MEFFTDVFIFSSKIIDKTHLILAFVAIVIILFFAKRHQSKMGQSSKNLLLISTLSAVGFFIFFVLFMVLLISCNLSNGPTSGCGLAFWSPYIIFALVIYIFTRIILTRFK